MVYKTEFILLVILNILDVMTTIYFLEFTHLIEGNPIALYLIDKIGYAGLIIPKVGMLGFFAWLLTKHYDELKASKFAKYGMWFMITYYIFVVTWNILGII